jgi:PAS domain-containing protein
MANRKGERRERELVNRLDEAGLAKGSDKAILITDPSGKIEYVNPAFDELTGYTESEATGLSPRILKLGKQDDDFLQATMGANYCGRGLGGRVDESD